MLKTLRKIFLSGLAVVLPLTITIYLLWWLLVSAERALSGLLQRLWPELGYLPGMGVALAIAIIFAVGLLARAWLLRSLVGAIEGLIGRIPLVKTVYQPLKDMMSFFTRSQLRPVGRVVRLHLGEGVGSVLGFVTQDPVEPAALATGAAEPLVAVYVPMSYQVGGFTLLVPRSSLETVDMSVEQAMRFALTAGVASGQQ